MVISQRGDHLTSLAVWLSWIAFSLLTDQQPFRTATKGLYSAVHMRLISHTGDYVISTNLTLQLAVKISSVCFSWHGSF